MAGRLTDRHGATLTEADAAEVRLIGADGAGAWLVVPFPPSLAVASGEDSPAVLIAHAGRDGVLVLRRRGHAIGVFAGSELVESKVDSPTFRELCPRGRDRAGRSGGRQADGRADSGGTRRARRRPAQNDETMS